MPGGHLSRNSRCILSQQKDKKPEAVQVALLLTTGSDDLLEIYNSLEFAPAADSNPDPSQV